MPSRPPLRDAGRASRIVAIACLFGLALFAAAETQAAPGTPLVAVSGLATTSSTADKPQSKLWYHDGSWWAILRGPDGVAFYEQLGSTWYRSTFVDAVLGSTGLADVEWTGSRLLVLLFGSTTRYFEYTYDASLRVWNLVPDFPVTLPRPSGTETMVLEQDSTGRVWAVTEGGGAIKAYCTTSADHRFWSSTPIELRTGVDSDDICSIVAFGGDKIGVLWSDQRRMEFGFRVHHDADPPGDWQPVEIASAGDGHADDHIHLAADSEGRVYAVTKDAFDRMAVQRRDADGTWTIRNDIAGGRIGTRPILLLAEDDGLVYVLWTDWASRPDRIVYRTASLADLQFGDTVDFIVTGGGDLNNVSSTKQRLPRGNLVAVAEGAGAIWWNGWGQAPGSAATPPGSPGPLVASLQDAPPRVDLAWSPPEGGAPDGYIVYRQQDGGTWARLTAGLCTESMYSDSTITSGTFCYRVTAFAGGQEGSPTAEACATYAPPPPPAPTAPLSLAANFATASRAPGALALAMDEGSGQALADGTGAGHTGQLGSTTGSDTADPLWTTGIAGAALRFDGSNDRVRVEDAPDLRQSASFTLEAWAQRSKLGSSHCIVSKGDSGKRNFWMELDSSNRVSFRWQTKDAKDHGTTSGAVWSDLAWHHVACVYDQAGGENRIYLDGRLVHSAPDAGTPVTSTDPLYVGAKTTSGSIKSVFSGTIDLVRVAPGALYAGDFVPEPGFPGGAPATVAELHWEAPESGATVGYHVERRADDVSFVRLTGTPVTGTSWVDTSPAAEPVCYRVLAVDGVGQEGAASEEACAASAPAAKAAPAVPQAVAPAGLRLAVGPNPFNPTTTIRFRVDSPARVRVVVYDVRGSRVALLLDEDQQPGEHSLTWNAGRELASGAYFLVVQAGDQQARQKLLLLK